MSHLSLIVMVRNTKWGNKKTNNWNFFHVLNENETLLEYCCYVNYDKERRPVKRNIKKIVF
jgi:hypothetical protein